jgi:hypothetical protein
MPGSGQCDESRRASTHSRWQVLIFSRRAAHVAGSLAFRGRGDGMARPSGRTVPVNAVGHAWRTQHRSAHCLSHGHSGTSQAELRGHARVRSCRPPRARRKVRRSTHRSPTCPIKAPRCSRYGTAPLDSAFFTTGVLPSPVSGSPPPRCPASPTTPAANRAWKTTTSGD